MFNTSKLKGRIIEKYNTQGAFAEKVHRTQAFISNVLNGNSVLDANDIKSWAEALEISNEDIGTYFFVS